MIYWKAYSNNILYSTDVDEQQYCSSSKKIHTWIFTLVKSKKKPTLWKPVSIEIKDVRGIISKNYSVKKGLSSKIYFGTSKDADVIWIIIL